MSKRVLKIRIKNVRERAQSNWSLAMKYQDHPVLGDKFLTQAVKLDDMAAQLASKL